MSDNYQEILNTAKTLLNGTDAQKKIGIGLLKKVVQGARGTPLAEKAMKLLLEYDLPDKSMKRDAELTGYLRRWNGINSFSNVGFLPLLKELKARPDIAAHLRTKILGDIRKWIADALPKVGAMKDKELLALEKFVEAIVDIQAYQIEEIKKLSNVLFGVRFFNISKEVHRALALWDMDKAWQLVELLNNEPDGFQVQVKELRDEIFKVDETQRDMQAFLSQLSKSEPESWVDMRTLFDALQRLHKYSHDLKVPDEQQAHLQHETQDCIAAAEAFLRKQATTIANHDNLKGFWAQYQRLDLTTIDSPPTLQYEWFDNYLTLVFDTEKEKVSRADSPETLKRLGLEILENGKRLPSFVATRMKSLADEIACMETNWESMRQGEDFDDPSSCQGQLQVPHLLDSESIKFRQFLNRLEEAVGTIKSHNGLPPSKNTYTQIRQTAQEILKQVPQHQRASQVKSDAEKRLLHIDLDAALATFDVENFFRLCETKPPEGVYAYFIQHSEVLRRIATLTRQEDFFSWEEAAIWWAQWRVARESLQQSVAGGLPDSFKNALEDQEALRTDNWYKVLNKLLDLNLKPEDCIKVAKSLMEELENLNLQGFHSELMRKATCGYVSQYISEGQFEEAARELAGLQPNHPDTISLGTRLNVERAIQAGVAATATVLQDNWSNIVTEYGSAAYTLLIRTVNQAWQDDDSDSLLRLRRAMSRAMSGHPTASELKMLQQWENWLRVEEAIKSETTRLNVNQLISYLNDTGANEEGLRERLKRLINHWQHQEDIKMLAWAYVAFNRLYPDIMTDRSDPMDEMWRRSDKVASHIIETIKTKSPLPMDECEGLRKALKDEEHEWNNLHDFLGSLRPPAMSKGPSDKFKKTLETLETLIAILGSLERLKNADLREESARNDLETIDWETKKYFGGFVIQQDLLKQIEQFEHLTKLEVPGNHIIEAAKRCGSEAFDDVYHGKSFANLHKSIQSLIDKFILAKAQDGTMWQKLSGEYCDKVYDLAGISTAKPIPPDLHGLADRIKRLQDEEAEFVKLIERLENEVPPVPDGGNFDPDRHHAYLSLFPNKPPSSKKVRMRFYRFAQSRSMQTIIRQSRTQIPDWVQEYVKEVKS
jgi:hypothetical protein